MPVVVIVTPAASEVLRQEGGAEATPSKHEFADSLRAIRSLDLTLTPVHPGSAGPRLSRYFQATATDRSVAERLIAELRKLPIIEAAYWKPAEETP